MQIARRLPEWIAPTELRHKELAHRIWAWTWFAFGIFGLVDYASDIPGWKVADSIPVLFFISVYANFTGHLSTSQAARAELKVDEGGN